MKQTPEAQAFSKASEILEAMSLALLAIRHGTLGPTIEVEGPNGGRLVFEDLSSHGKEQWIDRFLLDHIPALLDEYGDLFSVVRSRFHGVLEPAALERFSQFVAPSAHEVVYLLGASYLDAVLAGDARAFLGLLDPKDQAYLHNCLFAEFTRLQPQVPSPSKRRPFDYSAFIRLCHQHPEITKTELAIRMNCNKSTITRAFQRLAGDRGSSTRNKV